MDHRRMVALGSSFAAGPGIDPVVDRRAMRSGRNYPHLVAEALGAELTDATVSGATTAGILGTRSGRRARPAQVEAVPPDADLVTVTAGGNDLGYIGGILATAVRNRLVAVPVAGSLVARLWRSRPLTAPGAEDVEAATRGLVQVVAEVRRRAPSARVVLVDYLPVLDAVPRDRAVTGLDEEQVAHHRRVADVLTGVVADAAQRSGADLVTAYEAGHGVGAAEPWVNGVSLRQVASSFHPNVAGMRAVADAVLSRLASA